MKAIYKYLVLPIILGVGVFTTVSCEKLETTNEDPNNPEEVPSHMLMSGAQKRMMDDIYDNWFSARQCLTYSQYWAQRNYTEEDRYQIRESVNNGYFNSFYRSLYYMDRLIELNTDPKKAAVSANYGNNKNQIAAAKILKVWLLSIITDTWGSVPYTEAGKLTQDVYYAKYDDQKDIYAAMIKELTEASQMINVKEKAFTGGDIIYKGDASKWKKFANSLKCRLAIHLSKVDSNWKTYIDEALRDGVFESNADNAVFKYSTTGQEYCMFYSGYYVSGRNDFTITRPFMDILKGQVDTLNKKSHPWAGVVDPRLTVYTSPRIVQKKEGDVVISSDTLYIGIPFGIPSGDMNSSYRNVAPNWYANPPIQLAQDFAVPIMTYAELQFILSEYKGFSEDEYKKGVRASVTYWTGLSGTPISTADLDAYVDAVSKKVDAEAVALQKYIDLFMNGTEAWVEIRRTGYPDQLIRPGEISVIDAEGNALKFEPLSDTKGLIISRVKYPTNESTLNGANFNAAVSKLEGGTNNYYSKMYWDVRTGPYDHPANK